MNINDKNDTGQEKVVTKGRLESYVNWVNSTSGASFVEIEPIAGSGKPAQFRIKVNQDFSRYCTGNATIHWTNTTNNGTPSTSGTGTIEDVSLVISGPSGTNAPYIYAQGKIQITSNGFSGKTLQIDSAHSYNDFSGLVSDLYTPIEFTNVDEYPSGYCLSYSAITNGVYAPYCDPDNNKDGIIVNSYSIGDGKSRYSDNQLVVEKDVNFGNFNYNLEVSSITVEIDAMTDMEEYRYGFVPYTDDNIRFASVVNKVEDGTSEEFFGYSIVSGTTSNVEIKDNSDTKMVRYGSTSTATSINTVSAQHLHIEINGKIASAAKVNNNTRWQVEVHYYDGANTLMTTAVTAATGSGVVRSAITTSVASGTSGTAYVFIDRSNGNVYFDILQRKETYGYFPVDVYREGSDDFAIDENGNVAFSAESKFITADFINTDAQNLNGQQKSVLVYSKGWLSNAGDNFGDNAIIGDKTQLSSSDKSVYDDYMEWQGVSDESVCGKDVYNSNNIIYDRGVDVASAETGEFANKTVHIAYANDVYSENTTSGVSGSYHLYSYRGWLEQEEPEFGCSNGYLEYTNDAFVSEYEYDVKYCRKYYKDVHAYGLTSIQRRFRRIGGENDWKDTASSYTKTLLNSEVVNSNETISGNKFPKHILAKTINYETSNYWENIYTQCGEHRVADSAWTTVFEEKYDIYGTRVEALSATTRNVVMENSKVVCQENEKGEIVYGKIAPKFYMVDAETCSGAVSGAGYSFEVEHDIVDKTGTEYSGGTGETRYYVLECDYFGENIESFNYTNTQRNRGSMLAYYNVDSQGDVVLESTRTYRTGGNNFILSECCPHAPLQETYWIDSYAPQNTSDSGEIVEANGITFVSPDTMEVLSPSVNNWTVPGARSYVFQSIYSGKIDADKVTNWNKEENNQYSFMGDCYYDEDGNDSEHNLKDSISYANTNNITHDSNISNKIGYSVPYGYAFVPDKTYLAISGTGYDIDEVYEGDSFVYFNNSGNMVEYTIGGPYESKYYYFQPLVKNNGSGDALRECSGTTTIPYWKTDINFYLKVSEADYDIINEQAGHPVSGVSTYYMFQKFDIRPSINVAGSDIMFNAIAPTGSPKTVEVGGQSITLNYYGAYTNTLVRESGTSIDQEEKFYQTKSGVQVYLFGSTSTYPEVIQRTKYDEYGQVIEGEYELEYLYKSKLRIVFYEMDKLFETVELGLRCGENKLEDLPDLETDLTWGINLKHDMSVGADMYALLSQKDWGYYSENNKSSDYNTSGETLSCIGTSGNTHSIYRMLLKTSGSGSAYPYGYIKSGDLYDFSEYGINSKTGEQISDNMSHADLYW